MSLLAQDFDDAGPASRADLPFEEDDDEEGQGAADRLPETREELKKLKEKFQNNRRTAAFFYRNREIQYSMRVIYMGAQFVAEEFSTTIKLLQEGQASQLVFFSSR